MKKTKVNYLYIRSYPNAPLKIGDTYKNPSRVAVKLSVLKCGYNETKNGFSKHDLLVMNEQGLILNIIKLENNMKPKKLRKKWKGGEVWKNNTLWCVKKLLKRQLLKRTCRYRKHKHKDE